MDGTVVSAIWAEELCSEDWWADSKHNTVSREWLAGHNEQYIWPDIAIQQVNIQQNGSNEEKTWKTNDRGTKIRQIATDKRSYVPTSWCYQFEISFVRGIKQ